jgi:L-lactate dehydrogenase complex protein LldG
MTPQAAGLMQRFKHSAERAGTTTEVVAGEPAAVAAIAALADRLRAARVTATSPASRLAPAGSLVGGAAQAVADADLGVSTALAAVAETGSVLLASNVTEDRLVGMLAQTHVVVIEASSIVASLDDIADEVRRLTSPGPNQLRYCTLISGPSRTADIERVLTVGVQGPRTLHLILVEPAG